MSKSLPLLVGTVAGSLLWLATPSARASLLWIDDTANNIGTVDTVSGAVTVVGNANNGNSNTLTDIGFTSSGALYGVSFNNFYSINQATGAATFVSSLGVGSGGMNALVGAPGGTLDAASNNTMSLYSITPSPYTASTFTGVSIGATSAGDLAFAGGFLYESAINNQDNNDELIQLTLSGTTVTNSKVIDEFNLGATRFQTVFGLADDGTTMFGVNGTTIYSVDLATAALTADVNYSGHGLVDANGSAFINEAVPAPPIGHGLPAALAIGGLLFGAKLWERSKRRGSLGTAMPHAAA